MDHDVVASVLKRSGPTARRRARLLAHCLTFMDRAAGKKMFKRQPVTKATPGTDTPVASASSGEERTLTKKEQMTKERCLAQGEALGVIIYLVKAPRFIFAVGEKGAIIRSPDRCKIWRRMKNPELVGGPATEAPTEAESPKKKAKAATGGQVSENGTKLLSEDELTSILNLLPQRQTAEEELADLGDEETGSKPPPAGGGARAANAITARALLGLGEDEGKAKKDGTESVAGASVTTTQLGAPCPDLHGVACYRDSVVVVGSSGFIAVSHDKGISFKQIPFLVNMERYNIRQATEQYGQGKSSSTTVLPPSPKLNLRAVSIVPVDGGKKIKTAGGEDVNAPPVGRVLFYGGSYLFSFLLLGVEVFKEHQSQQYALKAAASRLGLEGIPENNTSAGDEGRVTYSWQSEGDVELVQKFAHPIGMLKVVPGASEIIVSTQNALHFGLPAGNDDEGIQRLPTFITVAHSIGLIRDLADLTDVYSDAEMVKTMGKLGEALSKQKPSEGGSLAAPKSSGSSKSYSYSATTVLPVENETQEQFVSGQLFPSTQRPKTRVFAVLGTNGPLVTYDFTSQLFMTQSRQPPTDANIPEGKIPVTVSTNVHKFNYVPFVQSNVHDRVGLAVQTTSNGLSWVRSTMGGLCVSTNAGESFGEPTQGYTGELVSLDDSTLLACNLKKAVVLSEDHGRSWKLLALPANLKVATLHGIAVME